MTKKRVKECILKIMKTAMWMTYPQFLRFLEAENIDVRGGFQLELPNKNVVLWGGMSQVVVESLVELITEGKLIAPQAPTDLYKIEDLSFPHPIVLTVPETPLPAKSIMLTFLAYVKEVDENVVPLNRKAQ